jgi:hypothetical protein
MARSPSSKEAVGPKTVNVLPYVRILGRPPTHEMGPAGFLRCTLAAALGIAALIGSPTYTSAASHAEAQEGACSRTEFKTELLNEACKTDQAAAKKAMQNFLKEVKAAKAKATAAKKDTSSVDAIKLTCDGCHSSLKKADGYPLKDDGLAQFEALLKFLNENK